MEQTEFRDVPPNNFSHVTETCQLTGPRLGLIFAVMFLGLWLARTLERADLGQRSHQAKYSDDAP